MEVRYISLDDDSVLNEPISACIGYFDGLHLGHQELINKANKYKFDFNTKSAMITFEPDPWIITKKLTNVKHINDFESKKKLLETFDIDYLLILKFTEQMASLKSENFIDMLISKINLKALVVGFDFKYGQFGSGNIDVIDNQVNKRFEVIKVDAICDDIGKISSSRIDHLLINGDITQANRLLGYDYFVIGKVVHGRKQGTKIGFPTANIKYDDNIILPKNGVYIGYLEIDNNLFKAMINIGNNPTFNYNEKVTLEVNIIDFDQQIYDKEVKIIFKKRIRDEKKFNSIDQLIQQLKIDTQIARNQDLVI